MKICFTELNDDERKYFESKYPSSCFTNSTLNNLSDEILKEVECACIFIHSKVDRYLLNKMPKLKYVITRSSGFNHINIELCKRKGIEVYNIPDYGDETVAEFTILLMLSSLRRIKEILQNMWFSSSINYEHLRGRDLSGKTVGVIGTGRIGRRVIKLLAGFNVNVLAYDINKHKEVEELSYVRYVSLDRLLRDSDIITLHVPLTSKTKHLINKDNIKTLKKGSIIINTSRGEVIENNALLYGINNGVLYACGLDVVEGENVFLSDEDIIKEEEYKNALINHRLLRHPNVIITPHIAYNTNEAINRIIMRTVDHIDSLINGSSISKEYRVV